MQVAAGASGSDVHRIVSIVKRARIRERDNGHTRKGSRKIIGPGPTKETLRKPKIHRIHLAHHGRDGLIKKALAERTQLRREGSRVRVRVRD
jgi:hypothetical protein